MPDHNFEPHYLDLYGENQKINVAMRYESFEAYSSNLKRCFVRNAEGLFFRREKEVPVDWIGNSKICVPCVKYFFNCVLENVSVEIWSKIVSYLDLIDVFHFSNVSKFFFAVALSNKTLIKKTYVESYFVI